MAALPGIGEIWFVSLDPTVGHEQSGSRPALVVSVDRFNHGPAGLVVVVPITSRAKGISLHVAIGPPEGGLTTRSFAMPENIRSISVDRLQRAAGLVSTGTLQAVQDRLRILLDL